MSDIPDFLNKFSTIILEKNNIKDKYKCGLCSKLLVNAFNTACGCLFCESCIKNYLEDGPKYCPSDKPVCQTKTIAQNDVCICYHINNKIHALVIKCPNNECDYEEAVEKIPAHLEVCDKNSNICPYRDWECSAELGSMTIEEHLRESVYEHLSVSKRHIESIKNDNILFKEEIDNLKQEILTLKNNLNLHLKPRILNEGIVWLLDSFEAKRNACISTNEVAFNSPIFYCMECAFSLKIYPNGAESQDYVSLYIELHKGAFDELILWPWKHSLKLELINQNEGYVHVSRVTDGQYFSNDENTGNTRVVFNEFIKYDELTEFPGLLVNDSVLFRCQLDRLRFHDN